MDQIAKALGNYMNEGSGAGPEYTPEQTTGLLMAFIDQMQVDEEQKARLRSNLLERLMNPDAFQLPEDTPTKGTGTSPEDIIKLIGLLVLVFGILGFFGYKLYLSIMEKEQGKGKKNKKEEKKSKKLSSPPSSPRSKKEK
ncbi:uncharacterized protein [Chironomus tepperi]|uniref:uncharacterized protein isoform X2 n=1 Tax=Chironomus tepperi TaxID=113505 RepID=UPI00391F26E4